MVDNKAENTEKYYRLVTKDKVIFTVHENICKESFLIKNLINDNPSVVEIDLENVESTVLARILEYCKWHADHPSQYSRFKATEPEIRKEFPDFYVKKEDVIKSFDKTFLVEIPLPKELECLPRMRAITRVLDKIAEAADFMDIPFLFHLLSDKIRRMVEGKNVKEMRYICDTDFDFVQDEWREVVKESIDIVANDDIIEPPPMEVLMQPDFGLDDKIPLFFEKELEDECEKEYNHILNPDSYHTFYDFELSTDAQNQNQ